LKRNTWAKYTDVFVGLDYPPSEKYREGYNNICQYLKADFNDFKSFNVIKRTENYGSSRNLKELRDMVLLNYDRFIRTDDDAEFSPNFIEYMNKCLEKYREDPNIIAVTGYSYPIDWHTSEGATVLKENFSCPMWGTGFWRDKYLEIEKYITEKQKLHTERRSIIRYGGFRRMTNAAKYEFVNLCFSTGFKNSLAARMSDISIRMYTAATNKYVIVPIVSKVRNWGFDGSGEYCGRIKVSEQVKYTSNNYPYHLQTIDTSDSFEIKEDKLNAINKNKKLMNKFDRITYLKRLWLNLKLIIKLCYIK
jgi:hypothetical protein